MSWLLNTFYTMPDGYLFVLLITVTIGASLLGILIVRKFIPLDLRYKDNPVIGTMSSLIGVIYGVLASFMAVYLINNISYTADAVQREANAVADIYRDSKWLRNPTRDVFQKNITSYIRQVTDQEWPLMRAGKPIPQAGDHIIDRLSVGLNHYPIQTASDSLIVADELVTIRMLYGARHQRIHMSYSSLNPNIWAVILIGTILMIGINYLFEMNFLLHAFTVSAASIMASSMIFLLIVLDRPFQDEFLIDSLALQSTVAAIHADTINPNE